MMTLDELMMVINENQDVIIVDSDTQTELARYDGNDSIPTEYNEWLVMDIVATADNELTVDIDPSDY